MASLLRVLLTVLGVLVTFSACNSMLGIEQVTLAEDKKTCAPGQKACEGSCVPKNDVETGCAGVSCEPCVFEHATAVCINGQCRLGACEHNYQDCNGNAADGCESFALADAQNCGACGRNCTNHATSNCELGTCKLEACEPGFRDCDANTANGCEVDATNDPKNCGACSNACLGLGLVEGLCQNATCESTTCAAGTGECDDNPSSVCETNLGSDLRNCGFCDNICAPVNAIGQCSAGECVLIACDTGFGDCNGDARDGCETELVASQNCGACGRRCSPGLFCFAGFCECFDGFDCDASEICLDNFCQSVVGQEDRDL